MDRFGLNYQFFHKMIDRPADGYKELMDMRSNLPHIVFGAQGFLSEGQRREMYRNLGHRKLEKQMKVVENVNVGHLYRDTRKVLKDIIDNCKACQLTY